MGSSLVVAVLETAPDGLRFLSFLRRNSERYARNIGRSRPKKGDSNDLSWSIAAVP